MGFKERWRRFVLYVDGREVGRFRSLYAARSKGSAIVLVAVNEGVACTVDVMTDAGRVLWAAATGSFHGGGSLQ
jgi:hypothetical protein